MKKYGNYIPLQFLCLYVIGIVTQFYLEIWWLSPRASFLVFGLLLLALCLLQRKARTIVAMCLFMILGLFQTYHANGTHAPNYYEHYLHKDNVLCLRVTKYLSTSTYYHKYYAKVVMVDAQPTVGQLLLNIEKGSQIPLNVDDRILLQKMPVKVAPPQNPYQFSYQDYLKQKDIYQQVYVKKNEFVYYPSDKSSLQGMAAKIRGKIQTALKKQPLSEEVYAVMNALLLGQKQELSTDLKEGYANAGAIHILAISGLHVGIILLVLHVLFKPLERMTNGKMIKTILIVLVLWFFALLAGLSASVVRAVTMFSFVAFGMMIQKKGGVWQSLLSSMLLLLLCKPLFLFDVGFQMSYLALFGILWWQPKLYHCYRPKFKLLDFYWRLLTVSLAAQIVILPLSIYYFHQIPTLFWLTNLVVIPVLGIILFLGLLLMLLSLANAPISSLAFVYNWMVTQMNSFIQWVGNRQQFLIEGLYLNSSSLWIIYLGLFSVLLFLQMRRYVFLMLSLLAILLFQVNYLFQLRTTTKGKFIVFHQSRASVLAEQRGRTLKVYRAKDSLSNSMTFLEAYQAKEHLKTLEFKTLQNMYSLKKKYILVIDSTSVYPKTMKEVTAVLTCSPKINLQRFIEEVKPQKIIADGSNYRSYVTRWRQTCAKYQVPFHSTASQGAAILE